MISIMGGCALGEEESVMIPAETADADVEGNTANQDQTDEKSAKKAEKNLWW